MPVPLPVSDLDVRHLGSVPYAEAVTLMRGLVRQRQLGEIGDTLLLLEHPPVITFGSRGTHEHVLDAGGIDRLLDSRQHFVRPGCLAGSAHLDADPRAI